MARWPERSMYDRIMDKVAVNPATECWEFQGGKQGKLGYGSVWIGGGKTVAAHRAMMEIKVGRKLGRWEFVCHKCDNAPCCNPEHLFIGSLADNNKDMAAKGRYNHQQRTHCVRGHEFTPENVYRSPSKPNKRQCRECQRERLRSAYRGEYRPKIYDGSVRRGERKPRSRYKKAGPQSDCA